MIFRGTFEHALDVKHRLTVPAKFRAALADGAVLAASPEVDPSSPRCISIWRPDDFEAYVDRMLGAHNPGSAIVRELERFFFNHSSEAELDSANRLMIPLNLMRYGGLDKEVVVAGSGRYIEVWDRPQFETYQEGVLARIPELTARLGNTA